MSRKILLTLALTTALFLVSACNDDDDNCVDCPAVGAATPTMANIWPHEDGTAWTYDLEYRELEPVPGANAKEGEIPTMEELHSALQEPMVGIVTLEGDGLYRFAFDGLITTDTGAVGQHVRETFFVDLDEMTKDIPEEGSTDGTPTFADRTLAMIARARPDLRQALVSSYGLDEKSLGNITPPMFLGGYAFSAEEEGYFSYGDLDQNHSWVYLEGDLTVGSEFSLQLVPVIADDIWLYGRVWSVEERTIGGRIFENVLECMYVVDFGESTATDENGNVIAAIYPYFYGVTLFAPDLGPVAGIERRVEFNFSVIRDPEPAMFEYVMDLVGVTYSE